MHSSNNMITYLSIAFITPLFHVWKFIKCKIITQRYVKPSFASWFWCSRKLILICSLWGSMDWLIYQLLYLNIFFINFIIFFFSWRCAIKHSPFQRQTPLCQVIVLAVLGAFIILHCTNSNVYSFRPNNYDNNFSSNRWVKIKLQVWLWTLILPLMSINNSY